MTTMTIAPPATPSPARAISYAHPPTREPKTPCQRPIHFSYSKYLERQIIRAWKNLTRANRKYPRASFVPQGFVFVNARRRSVLMA